MGQFLECNFRTLKKRCAASDKFLTILKLIMSGSGPLPWEPFFLLLSSLSTILSFPLCFFMTSIQTWTPAGCCQELWSPCSSKCTKKQKSPYMSKKLLLLLGHLRLHRLHIQQLSSLVSGWECSEGKALCQASVILEVRSSRIFSLHWLLASLRSPFPRCGLFRSTCITHISIKRSQDCWPLDFFGVELS